MKKRCKSRKQLYFIILFIFLTENLFSQTFSNANATSITDNGSTVIPVNVSGLPTSIDTVNFGLESVTLNISHPANSQLRIQLESPDGSAVYLANHLPGINFTNTTFDGISGKYIDFGSAPYTGNYRSIQDLSYLNNSQNPNGIWKLIVEDNAAGNTGVVQNVSLQFGNKPAGPLLLSSNLPIIIINTHGNEIVDNPKVQADMNIIFNGPGKINYANQTNYNFSGKIGIEFRGHSSQMFPKKQYGFETRNDAGTDGADVGLLGLPKESDWILNANYSDKTMMRNVLSYELSREMGNYASRTIYCELIVNNEYKGVFVLMEKIKRNKNRVNVEKLTDADITPPNVTGGYVFSQDKLDGGEITWHSKIQGSSSVFQFVYPKKEKDLAPEQKTYLENYVDSFEQALNGSQYKDPANGFRKYADEVSFMDFFIINELARNIDGFRLSSYFHKSREGKLVAGPVWDFDIAWGNADYYDGSNPVGFDYSYNFPSNDWQVPFWWARLRMDDGWKKALNCRYSNFRDNVLSTQRINAVIDSLANELRYAEIRNFIRWGIMGKYVWPNPQPIPQTYSDAVSYLKDWIGNRLNFLDNELRLCAVVTPGERVHQWKIVPNPTGDQLTILSPLTEASQLQLNIYNVQGQLAKSDFIINNFIININISTLSRGIYFVRIGNDKGNMVTLKFIKN